MTGRGHTVVRAAVLRVMGADPPYAASRPLGIEELELTPPGPGEIQVRVRAAGLCHSDLSVIDGRVVVKDGRLATLDLPVLIERHNRLARELVDGPG